MRALCSAWRAALSAMLDGEEPELPVASVAAHLTGCPDCSAWLDQAAAVNRGLRLLPVIDPELGERLVNGVDVQLCACRAAGLQVFATDGEAGIDLTDLDAELSRPTAWVMGNEAWGLPSEHLALADNTVAVPIYGHAESLNLATAAAICLYASASAQRASN